VLFSWRNPSQHDGIVYFIIFHTIIMSNVDMKSKARNGASFIPQGLLCFDVSEGSYRKEAPTTYWFD
jgi:hypothetical protein